MIRPKIDDSLFVKAYSGLNKRQKQAVDTIEGPVMVVAGPGTGKTTILTLRIANILKKTDTTADCILALTFTDSGVHSMRQKLLGYIGAEAYKVQIQTFHGFCNDVIKSFPEEFPRIIGAMNMTGSDEILVMREVFDSVDLPTIRSWGAPYHYLKTALTHISNLKREDIDPKEYEDYVKREEKVFATIDDLYYDKGVHKGKMKGGYIKQEKQIRKDRDMATVYTAYQALLVKKKFYDYADMIMEAVRALKEKPNFLLELQEQYQYILADEHQDANQSQNKLLELLSNFHESPNLFIVGDEKQAIYRFQGASVGNFSYFKKLYPEAIVINLEENYRSNQTILDASHALITKSTHAKGFEPVPLSARAAHPIEKIGVITFPDALTERRTLIADIKKKMEGGVPAEEIAVLFRNNRSAEELRRDFSKENIPFSVSTDQNLLDEPLVRKLRMLFETIVDLKHDEKLAETLFIDFLGLPPLDVYKIMAARERRPFALIDMVRTEKQCVDAKVENPKLFNEFAEKIFGWSRLAKNKGLVEVFEQVVRESGLLSSLIGSHGSVEEMGILSDFFAEAKRLEESNKKARLADFLEYIRVLEEHEVSVGSKRRSLSAGTVKLMTAHKSKGLEFDYVYIIGVNNGVWGNTREHGGFSLPFENDTDSIEYNALDDERRLFYVALTRARKKVTVTYPRAADDGKELLPSQFIEEIDESLREQTDVSPQVGENETAAKITATFAARQNLGPSIADRDYLRELFLEQGLNPTALNAYLECPWKYFFNNLIHIPSAKDKSLMYGSAIHAALEEFFNQYKQEKEWGKDELISSFGQALDKQPLSEKDYEDALKKGKKALTAYYGEYKGTWIRSVFVEFKIGGILLPIEVDGKIIQIPLKGKLDKIELLSNEEVNVVDYKTGKQKSRNEIEGNTKNSDGGYKRQLVFYKYLIDNYGRTKASGLEGFRMVSAELDFVEPDERGKCRKEKFVITDEEVSSLEGIIRETAMEIYNGEFWNKKCGEEMCQHCLLGENIKKHKQE